MLQEIKTLQKMQNFILKMNLKSVNQILNKTKIFIKEGTCFMTSNLNNPCIMMITFFHIKIAMEVCVGKIGGFTKILPQNGS